MSAQLTQLTECSAYDIFLRNNIVLLIDILLVITSEFAITTAIVKSAGVDVICDT